MPDRIAEANQRMEVDWETHPFNTRTGTWRHFRNREAIVIDLRSAVVACDLVAFGQHLHSYQDSFSHAGFSWPGTLGHVPYSAGVRVLNFYYGPFVKLADPDDYNEGSQRENDMTIDTAGWMLQHWTQCKCE